MTDRSVPRWNPSHHDGLLPDVLRFVLVDQTVLQFTGDDRATVLHNLCTNNVKALASGQGCEAFVTNVQGRTVGHIVVYARDNDLLVTTVPGQAPSLTRHFDRYIVTEDARIVDLTSESQVTLLVGPGAPEIVGHLGLAPLNHPHDHVFLGDGRRGLCARGPLDTEPWYCLVTVGRETQVQLDTILGDLGVAPGPPEIFESIRIEAGWPKYGVDFTDQNLPQELARDGQAISFTKGCYLGQETVARLDALGHVNRLCR
ncbi:MAG TPA: hypothetical protein VIY86_08435, partial [Pirellulaceae bacterium]